jgi:hypothetical protein
MAKQPFSAPRPRSLPTSTPTQDINQTLANWQIQLQPLIQNVAPQATPQNFGVTNSRGGLTLSWSPVSGSDGYEILRSLNGSFTDDLQVIPVKNSNQSSYFDGLGGNATAAHYRIRTTSGTAANPQSQRGPESGPVSHTSIDAADTKSVPVTILDNSTTDITRSGARRGNYGAIKVSPLGQSGGSQVSSGANSRGVTSNLRPPVQSGGTSFGTIGTGSNNSGVTVVAAGASIVPDPNNPGVIDANQVQGTPVTNAAPTDGQILQYSAANGQVQYASIIAVGVQAGLQSVLPLGLGEIYVATDTGNLFIGTPGVGAGYLQVSDMSQMNDTFQQILAELKAVRLAIVALDSTLLPQDFEVFGKQIENGDAVGETQ